ncbi:MAG: hypothetical protein U0R19_22525 [Bryobacteraceae bacterium]
MDPYPLSSDISPRLHTFRLPTEYRYLSRIPYNRSDLLFLLLHGYGMNAQTMFSLTLPFLPESAAIASIQAPNQFYLGQTPANSTTGYNWGTRAHGDASIALHHEMVLRVSTEMRELCGLPRSRTILIGFSQPVGFNYRFAATFPKEIGGVIGICGGVPKDWETGTYGHVEAPLLHIARDEDEFFPAAVTTDYARKLRTRAGDVEFHSLPGGHRFPSKGKPIIQQWLIRNFGLTSAADGRP